MPAVDEFDYSFDNLAKLVESLSINSARPYSLYLMDYGAPIGFRLAARHPERVQSLIVQNGNAYDEGLREFWDPIKAYWKTARRPTPTAAPALLTLEATSGSTRTGCAMPRRSVRTTGTSTSVSSTREGNQEIQLALFYDYAEPVPLYPAWQAYLREHQPPTLIVWGKNDQIFPAEGAHPYRRDLKNLEFHLLDTGHFALEEDGAVIARRIRDFLSTQLAAR